MKTCPVCGARAFDDAETCYGCLHRFDEEDGALAPKLPAPKAKGTAAAVRGTPSACAATPCAAAPAAGDRPSVPTGPEPDAAQAATPTGRAPDCVPADAQAGFEPACPVLSASSADSAPVPACPASANFVPAPACPASADASAVPCAVVPAGCALPLGAVVPGAVALSFPQAADASADGWTVFMEWAWPAEGEGATAGLTVSIKPALPMERGSHARAAPPAAKRPQDEAE